MKSLLVSHFFISFLDFIFFLVTPSFLISSINSNPPYISKTEKNIDLSFPIEKLIL